MQQSIILKLLPHEAENSDIIKEYISLSAGKPANNITGYSVHKKSIDARGKQAYINLTIKRLYQ